jgi:hypothetical protein
VLGGHGPNLGIGGGLYAVSEGVLSALSWLASGVVPGVWLVFTGWSPEYLPDLDGSPRIATRCEATAVALTPVSSESESRAVLRIVEPETAVPPLPPTPESFAERLESLFAAPTEGPRVIRHEAHDGRGYSRPHRPQDVSRSDRRVTVGTDATGRHVIELAAPRISRRGATT